jgi:hypothetical protein
VGALIMLGTLVGLVVLVYWLVLRCDPEAMAPRKAPPRTADGPAARGVASAGEQSQSAEAQDAPEWTDDAEARR